MLRPFWEQFIMWRWTAESEKINNLHTYMYIGNSTLTLAFQMKISLLNKYKLREVEWKGHTGKSVGGVRQRFHVPDSLLFPSVDKSPLKISINIISHLFSERQVEKISFIVRFSCNVERERIGTLFFVFNEFFPLKSVMIAFIKMKKCKIKFYWVPARCFVI